MNPFPHIRDKKEFLRLFPVRIPWEPEFEYYCRTLMCAPEYAWLAQTLRDFEALEQEMRARGENLAQVKMQLVDRLRQQALGLEAVRALESLPLPPRPGERDWLKQYDGRVLISLDIRAANFTALRALDSARSLPESWEAWAAALEVPPLLAQSKSFRQLVFGHIHPARLQAWQAAWTESLRLHVQAALALPDYALQRADELVVVPPGDGRAAWDALTALATQIETGTYPATLLPAFRGVLRLRVQAYRLVQAEPGIWLKSLLDPTDTGWTERERRLFSLPGSLFYRYFKPLVLGEPPEERDLWFPAEGRLARWVLPD